MRGRILLADDHAVVRQALKVLLEDAGFQVVGEASHGHEAVRLARELAPDVAVLDMMMPVLNGLEAGREIHQACPATRTLLLTSRQDEQLLLEALHAGFRGCVLKTFGAEDLIRALRDVVEGGVYLSPVLSRCVVEAYRQGGSLPPDPLTARERQVLQLIAEGKTTKETAAVLDVSVKTAETHRTNLMEKLDIHSTAGLVRYAIRRGLLQP
jgi:DNA-binding NarL/FixJ family response regulator